MFLAATKASTADNNMTARAMRRVFSLLDFLLRLVFEVFEFLGEFVDFFTIVLLYHNTCA